MNKCVICRKEFERTSSNQKSIEKIIIFELEMKTSEQKQKMTIRKIQYNLSKYLHLFVCILYV